MSIKTSIFAFVALLPFISISSPRIVFDVDSKPFPRTPFPHSYFTKPSERTVTGLKVSYPTSAPTQFERGMRENINELDGFGLFSPLVIPFSEPLKLSTVNNDSIFLLSLGENFGERVLFDFESGVYPVHTGKPNSFFENDPLRESDNFLFRPNNRKDFYDDETNTIILRPLSPLRPATQYLVVVTRNLKGENGEDVAAPLNQPLVSSEIVERLGLNPHLIVYGWTFTTQSLAPLFNRVSQGFKGEGEYAFLKKEYEPRFYEISNLGIFPYLNNYVLQPVLLQSLINLIFPLVEKFKDYRLSEWLSFSNIDYMVFGSFLSPELNMNPDRHFKEYSILERQDFKKGKVTFMITIPKPTAENNYAQAPYPLAIYGHGNKRSRIDGIGIANVLARKGIATITIDASGHGPDHLLASLPTYLKSALKQAERKNNRSLQKQIKKTLLEIADLFSINVNATNAEGLDFIDWLFSRGLLRVLTGEGRARDIDGDGIADSGEDFFTANLFQTRDLVRQTVIDYMQLMRVLEEGLSHSKNPRTGDFNQDGTVDIKLPVMYVGQSMGGIIGSLVSSVIPQIQTLVLNVAGGGLFDIAMRSGSHFVTKRTFHQICGPAVVGKVRDGKTYFIINNDDPLSQSFATMKLTFRNKIVVTNTNNKISREVRVNKEGGFFAPIPSDVGDTLLVQVKDGDKEFFETNFVLNYQQGLGILRNTSEFRDFANLAQWIVDPADPINYAGGASHKNILLQLSAGDDVVPVSAGLNLARAFGLVLPGINTRLISEGYYEGVRKQPDFLPDFRGGSYLQMHNSHRHEYLTVINFKEPEFQWYTFSAQEEVENYLSTSGQKLH